MGGKTVVMRVFLKPFVACCFILRASDNWKVLKELEKAAKVYWNAKDRLPPRVFQTSSLSSEYKFV